MTHRYTRRSIVALLPALAAWPAPTWTRERGAAGVKAEIVTSLGTIGIFIDTHRAPISANNFLEFIDKGLFTGSHFYRSVHPDNDQNPAKISVLQGGVMDEAKMLPPIAHETTRMTGLRHLNGSLSIGRGDPGTGTAGAFFICIGNQPELDFGGHRNPDGQGFAAFGRVTHGMEPVRTIWNLPTSGTDGSIAAQMLKAPVEIQTIRRV